MLALGHVASTAKALGVRNLGSEPAPCRLAEDPDSLDPKLLAPLASAGGAEAGGDFKKRSV